MTPLAAAVESYHTLGALELNSIAAGVDALDRMIKEAPIRVLHGAASSPGKFLILITGEVAEVERALGAGDAAAGDSKLDGVLLPAAAHGLRAALADTPHDSRLTAATTPAIAVVETFAAPTLLGGVDGALKTGETSLEAIHLLRGIGGKATALLSGDVESLRVALSAAASFAEGRQLLARQTLIPRPDPATLAHLQAGPGVIG